MKKLLSILLLCAVSASAQVVFTNIQVGTAANDGTGDTLRTMAQKINYALTSVSNNIATNSVVGKLDHTTGTGTNLTLVGTNLVTARGSTTARGLEDREAEVVKVKDYGALADATDDAPEIQAAIDAARDGTLHKIIDLPPGVFVINSTLLDTNNGSYVHFRGAGKHQTYIKAGAAMDQLIKLGLSGNTFDGRKTFEGITFDQNELATVGVDATELAYSVFKDCEFINPPTNGVCLKIGKWVNRVENCIFDGGENGIGIELAGTPFNNLIISDNSFTDFWIGIKSANGLADVQISENTFDACAGAAIWARGGSYGLGIRNNFFEACGANGVPVETAASTFTTYRGAIIANPLYNAVSSTPHENLIIEGNHFANCSSDSIITLANIIGAKVRNNHIQTGYTHTNFVNLRWTGSLYTVAKANEIEYTSTGATVINPVGLNGDDVQQNSGGLRLTINDKVQYSRFPNIGGEIYGNPLSWSSFGTTGTISLGRDGTFEDYKAWKIERSSGSDYYLYKTIAVNTTGSVSSIQGPRYLRIQYATRGDVGNANGLEVTALVDGVAQVQSSRTSETWRAGENLLVYIPSTATNLQITLTPVTSTIPCWVTKFSISDASVPFGHEQSLTDLDFYTQTAVPPTYGTWTTGDPALYKSVSASGYIGAICTLTGSPGTWVEFGPTKTVIDAITGGSGDDVYFNDVNATHPNFADSATITWTVTGTNVTATAAGGGATEFDDIGDPSGSGAVALAGTTHAWSSSLDSGIVLEITDTDADAAANTTLFKLSHNDGADANVIYLWMEGDKDGTPTLDHVFSQSGYTTIYPITAPTFELGASDTTLSRSSAGVAAVEGNNIITAGHTFTGDVTATVDTDGSTALVIADSVSVTGWALGASTATTPAENDNDTSVATTAYVQTEIASLGSGVSGTVVNTGTPVQYTLPMYSDTTGTNVEPSNITISSDGDDLSIPGTLNTGTGGTEPIAWQLPYGGAITNAANDVGLTNDIPVVFNSNAVFNATVTASGDLMIGSTNAAGKLADLDSVKAPSANPTLTSAIVTLNGTADGLTDDTYDGITITGRNAGETVAQWELVRFHTDNEFHLADADAAGEFPARGIAVAGSTDGNAITVLVQGIVRNDGWAWGTIGGPIYLSDTVGGLTQTAPSTAGDAVQIVGWALSDDEAYLNFSGHWVIAP